jgi:hypothetical protein
MLKTFTASLIPAMALASNKATFELNKITSLTYTGGKNIKGEER